MGKIDLMIIAGPTAVGKTDISLKIAKECNGEIISADSMQIYKQMDIGSAKIKKEDMQGITHHLIDVVPPDEPFSAAQFKELAISAIEDIHSRGKLPIIAGGTGLYIDSVICNFSFTESDKDPEYRKSLENLATLNGNEYVHSMLRDIDEVSYKTIHPNNVKRVIRALEVFKNTGKPFSAYSDNVEKYNVPYNISYFVLTMDREKLYERINKRVDIMMDMGLLEEVTRLKELGYTSDMQSMQGIGYKELLYYIDGKMTLENAVDMIKQGSRNYAKRQLTWFRKDPRVIWIDKDEYKNEDDILQNIIKIYKSSQK